MTVVHRYWWSGGPSAPHRYLVYGQVWNHYGFTVRDWTDDTLPPDVRSFVEANTHRAPGDESRLRSGLVKWAILAREGGIWSDHDVKPLRSYDPPETFIGATHRKVCAALVGDRPDGPLATTMLAEAERREGDDALAVTGQHILELVSAASPSIPVISVYDDWVHHEWATSRARRRAKYGRPGRPRPRS